jgi:hypothetical protein
MTLARDAKLDGFALNMGWNETTSVDSLANAFKAANALGNFKLFFSLDYAGNGPWPQKEASAFINKWKSDAAYFKYNGKPLVPTSRKIGRKSNPKPAVSSSLHFLRMELRRLWTLAL